MLPFVSTQAGVERDSRWKVGGIHSRDQRLLPAGDRGVLQPQLLQDSSRQDRRVPADGCMIPIVEVIVVSYCFLMVDDNNINMYTKRTVCLLVFTHSTHNSALSLSGGRRGGTSSVVCLPEYHDEWKNGGCAWTHSCGPRRGARCRMQHEEA